MSAPSLCSAFAMADSSTLWRIRAAFRGLKRSRSTACLHREAADLIRHEPPLLGRQPRVSQLRSDVHRSAPRHALVRRFATCPRKVRVGANSPSLCPTMFSVISTGTCWRPLCHRNGEPDHVRNDHRASRPRSGSDAGNAGHAPPPPWQRGDGRRTAPFESSVAPGHSPPCSVSAVRGDERSSCSTACCAGSCDPWSAGRTG